MQKEKKPNEKAKKVKKKIEEQRTSGLHVTDSELAEK